MAPDSQQSQPRLGFIGLGAMGSRMAGRLLAAGYDLTVFNRGRERTRTLEQRRGGMITAADGALYEARAGAILINMSRPRFPAACPRQPSSRGSRSTLPVACVSRATST
jgi:pyrroline-5-carboxylate reductase